ncbi:alanine--glyoxylate transaminase NDAI_0G03130 [Naumovozyma dairenensis CBS 421]|uniref:alanine--glyoxylate transaminase n=1 Tax=Naumovozyma dairenensis (strain ATCC 10597 / BCRC 20456 / CBS 421 / NBRC 0211 / NRRL Y-12639) TaxID=1071378 RepID=G0WE79_NAUDC|nr:hypothetical protein NDAI_0G03130 [Naumovozyma dairenensis CBS 421]CCD26090.2 hypothetical protein NDAI_0G03130 [Naumovozyma dairenensis CBS 421]
MYGRIFPNLFTRRTYHKMTTGKQILLVPGPVTLSPQVQTALSQDALSHTGAEFVSIFQNVLKNTRKLFKSYDMKAQPIVIAGSGTLGFDIAGSNLIKPKDKVLVLSTGFFSDSFADCLQGYGAEVTKLTAPLGDVVPLQDFEDELKKGHYTAVVATHVDTSTGVLNDIESISEVVQRISPESFLFVDSVCAIGCETMEFDKWKVDYCLTASQKAIGAPPGLSISMISERALQFALGKRNNSGVFFTSLKRWSPILKAYEGNLGAYFATPPTQLINSLDVALKQILETEGGIDGRVLKHKETSDWFKDRLCKELNLKLVSKYPSNVSAHGLTSIYVPNPKETILSLKERGFIIAGGLHKEIASQYIRIGHMGVSACDDELNHIPKCFKALKDVL